MSKSNPFLKTDQQIVGDIYTNMEIWNNLETLCDEFGSRFGGTKGEKLAANFIKEKLESYGLSNVYLEEIPYEGWRRGTVSLEILEPIQKTIPCISLPHSPPANLEAELVDLEDGDPADFDSRVDEMKGKIVLTTSEVRPNNGKRWVHRNEKYGRSILGGATGFIFVNHYPGYGPATGGVGEMGAGHIPAISVSYEDGKFLQRLLKKNGRVRLKIQSSDQIEQMISWNIISDLPGQKDPDQIIMLGCHYDGHDISQGATDPASGAVAVLETARVLAKYAPNLPYTVRFALWGIEEIGLIGSTFHVEQHVDEMNNFRFYLNLDSAGALPYKDIVLNQWPDLVPTFKSWSDEMALYFKVGQSISAHSDHYPFLLEGVPTGAIGNLRGARTGRGYGHTHYDTLDKAEITSLREAAVLAARLAMRIASDEEWPVQQRGKDEIKEVLSGPENDEETAIFEKIHQFYAQAREN
ncbi:MAG: M28 family peptidase [Chloroflexota bacterium]